MVSTISLPENDNLEVSDSVLQNGYLLDRN